MLPIFATAPCCVELLGSLAQAFTPWRGWGADSAATLLAGCLFCVCLGSGSFYHDRASHCSALFWSLDALFVFRLPPFPPLDSLAPPLARAGDVRPPVRPHVRPYVRPPAKPSCGFQHTHGSEFLSLANILYYNILCYINHYKYMLKICWNSVCSEDRAMPGQVVEAPSALQSRELHQAHPKHSKRPKRRCLQCLQCLQCERRRRGLHRHW